MFHWHKSINATHCVAETLLPLFFPSWYKQQRVRPQKNNPSSVVGYDRTFAHTKKKQQTQEGLKVRKQLPRFMKWRKEFRDYREQPPNIDWMVEKLRRIIFPFFTNESFSILPLSFCSPFQVEPSARDENSENSREEEKNIHSFLPKQLVKIIQ